MAFSQNCWQGRQDQKIRGIVIHIAEGNFEPTIRYCYDPSSQVSYHFLISLTGQIEQLVSTDDSAWHAGLVRNPKSTLVLKEINPNLYTLGIALAGFSHTKPTKAQILACSGLIKSLCSKYDIPLDENHIIPHNYIRSDKICPGKHIQVGTLIYLASLE